MKTNWLKTVNRINASKYTIPEGWDTKEAVAESLQCDHSKVADLLKPGISAGEIERKDFPIWDDKRRMTARVTCYRVVESGTAPEKRGLPTTKELRIAAAIRKYPDLSDYGVSRKLSHVTASEVKAIRKTL